MSIPFTALAVPKQPIKIFTRRTKSEGWPASFNQQSRNHVDLQPQTDNKHKLQRRKHGVPRIAIWYLASSMNFLLRKAKAFYNGCCCDGFKDSRVGNEVMPVDPYFSIPVIIPDTIA